MSFLTWLIFGLLAGAFSYLVAPERDFASFLQVIILSVMGAILGGFLANLIFGASITNFNLSSLIVAMAGSLLLILIPKIFSRKI